MKTRVFFIRHGQTEWNKEERMQGWQNSSLTATGKNQALLLGEKLKEEKTNMDVLYTSPSLRAVETSYILNQFLSIKICEELGFQEINMGDWEGKTYEEISLKYPEEWQFFWQNPDQFKAENKGETFEELSLRSFESLKKILNENKGKQIGIVSHRITIKSMIASLLKISVAELADIKSNSVTEISILNGVVTLEKYSDVSHYKNLTKEQP